MLSKLSLNFTKMLSKLGHALQYRILQCGIHEVNSKGTVR
jgi:hypothetical protein